MKTQKFRLAIQEPCQENWNNMNVEGAGRYCNSCSKVVVDFTSMTDEEIIKFLQNRKGETCGRVRMRESQLNHEYIFVKQNANPFRNVAFRYAVAGILTFASLKSAAQSGVKSLTVTNYVKVKDNSGKVRINDQNTHAKEKHSISVRVLNKFTGKSLTNAYVQIEGVEGIFRCEKGSSFILIDVPDSMAGKTLNLYINSVGFETEYNSLSFKAGEHKKDLTISLSKEESIKMGKMIYVPDLPDSTKKCSK